MWSVRAQVSDYFDLDALTLSDVLSDGQRFDPSFVPTLQVREQGVVASVGAFAAANFDGDPQRCDDAVTFRSATNRLARVDSVLEGGAAMGLLRPRSSSSSIRSSTRTMRTATVLHDDTVAKRRVSDGHIDRRANPMTDNRRRPCRLPLATSTESPLCHQRQPRGAASPLVTSNDVMTFRLQYTVPTALDGPIRADRLPAAADLPGCRDHVSGSASVQPRRRSGSPGSGRPIPSMRRTGGISRRSDRRDRPCLERGHVPVRQLP